MNNYVDIMIYKYGSYDYGLLVMHLMIRIQLENNMKISTTNLLQNKNETKLQYWWVDSNLKKQF